MAFLSPDTWIGDLEDAIVTHITTRLTANSYSVDFYINREIPRVMGKPAISIINVGGATENTGGMNIIGLSATSVIQQSKYQIMNYVIGITTDDATGKQTVLNKLSSVIARDCFEQHQHTLLDAIGGIDLTLSHGGYYAGGEARDGTLYQRYFELSIRLIIPDDIVT